MNQDNLDKIEECFRDARITGELSDSSIEKYQDSIKKFFSVVGKDIEQLDLRDFGDFILAMRDGGASNSRIANVISAVKWLIRNLQAGRKIPETLDLEKVKKPRIKQKDVLYLTEDEIRRFLGCIEEDIEKYEAIRKTRMMALVIFLLESGARIGEILSIKTESVDWENKEVPIIGKGGRPRTLFFRERTSIWLKRYLKTRKSTSDQLFVTLDGESKWSQTDVGRSFRRYKRLSGISKKFTLHTLRHCTATHLASKGVAFNKIQKILGHARLETTTRYYIGAVEKADIKRVMQDSYYDFIPESALRTDE